MTEPAALGQAKLLDGLCQRWSCPPSVILEEDAGLVLPMLAIIAEASEDDGD